MMVEQLRSPPESVRFPLERAAVANIQSQYNFTGEQALLWGIREGLVQQGHVVIAEVSPTLRCPEACSLCPDSSILLAERIEQGLATKYEDRADPELFRKRVKVLSDLGVEHFMIIGGTVDHLPELPELVKSILGLDRNVSWFTDMITQIDQQTGQPSIVMRNNLAHGWLQKVATHLSMDYPYNGDLFSDRPDLPVKRGRSLKFAQDGEYSRRFKSEYGVVGARRLIEACVRRVVVNITVGPKNLYGIPDIYSQVARMQKYAEEINSPTEVLVTFSEMIFRPQQARGDSPIDSPSSAGLQMEDIPLANRVFTDILDDTYDRIALGKPRLLANSSGYTHLIADLQYRQIVVDQELPYEDGRPEMYQVTPKGDVWLDPMFPGPELRVVNSIFGYRDRVPSRDRNPFVRFQSNDREWFPNIVTT